MDESKDMFKFISDTNLKSFYVQNLLGDIIKLRLLEIGINTSANMTNEQTATILFDSLEYSIDKINLLSHDLLIENHPIKPNKAYIELYEFNTIPTTNDDGSTEMVN